MSPRRRLPRHRSGAPSQTPATYIAARARNALRRPAFIATVSVVTFVAALVALVVVPQQARKAAAALRPAAASRPDTEPTYSALLEAERQVRTADSTLVATRAQLARLVAATAAAAATDTTAGGQVVSAPVRSRRDTLAGQVALLSQLMTRAANAPLLGSYRALAEASPMQGDARVKPLLDSLAEIERERESYNAVGGVDPVFVALTARANELGHNIEAVAEARRAALRQELAALAPPAPVLPTATQPLPDTLEGIRARDAARVAAAGVAERLARERAELLRLDAREEKARELASVGASPSAMLAAALIFGAMLGFGVALFDEVRRPRISDGHEAERATGVRVLGIITPLPAAPERGRRAAERAGPQFIDPGADGHQLVYQTIATAGSSVVMLTVTGDSPAVSAVVAINFAAIAADEARSTLLVDTDGDASSVAAALKLRTSASLRSVVEGRASWHDAIRTAQIGRDRTIDVVISGTGTAPVEQLSALLQRESGKLAHRYDALVLVSSADQVTSGLPAALPIPDVIFCARAGQTPIAELKKRVADIQAAGGVVRGLVLWNAIDPVLAEVRPAEETEREAVTA